MPYYFTLKLSKTANNNFVGENGNKRASVIFANHYLISNGMGLLVIPFELVPEFKKILVEYYEDRDLGKTKKFLLDKCYLKMN